MKFTILCDEKPKSCSDCPFYAPVPTPTAKNVIDMQDKCILGECTYDTCPLNVVNTVFDTELPPVSHPRPTHPCYHCENDVEYFVRYENVRAVRDGVKFSYVAAYAECANCGERFTTDELTARNKEAEMHEYYKAKDDTYA